MFKLNNNDTIMTSMTVEKTVENEQIKVWW